MRKIGYLTAMAAGILTMALSVPTFAAEWKQDEIGWWYQNDDGSYLNNGWNWIDGKCYYFNESGYCLLNTQTPDGYLVDANGAWIQDGVVQVQESSGAQFMNQAGIQTQVGTLAFTVPDGFMKIEELSSGAASYFTNRSADVIIGVVSEEIPDIQGYEGLVDSMGDTLLDAAMEVFGTVNEKTTHTFETGSWNRYLYANTDALGIPGSFYAYGRIQNGKLEMVVFAGNLTGINMNKIMNQNLR